MRLFQRNESDLDGAIEQLKLELNAYAPGEPEWNASMDRLERLIELRGKTSPARRVSPDTLALVAGNLLGILVIVGYEHSHVMVSKASGFIIRPKESHI
jgi:hypothetical protein